MTYQTEEEQVEALKQWWKENGRSVVAGVVLGLGAVLGWRGWHQYQESLAGQASTAFEQLSASIAGADRQATRSQAEQILGKFHSSPYAVFSALALARSYAEDGNAAAARTQLEWALANAGEPALEHVARLRLARLLLDGGDLAGVDGLLQGVEPGSFADQYARLRGDLALARGDAAGARTAYTEALAEGGDFDGLVRMQLDELGAAGGGQ